MSPRSSSLLLAVVLASLGVASPSDNAPMLGDTNLRCSAFICGLEMCLPVSRASCDGEIRENATECGCCPNCIKYLDLGRACGTHGSDFPEEPTTMCRPPLVCLDGYCNNALATSRPKVSIRRRSPQYREQINMLNFVLWH